MVEQIPLPIIYTLLIIFGLCIGSFLNVCIYRMPRDKSIVSPRSFCPKCRTPIKWYYNIPVFGYLLLRGRCRNCKRPISPRYPLVELLSAFFSWFVFYKFQSFTPYFIYYLLLISPLLIITFIDIEHRLIPDMITLPGIIAGGLSQFILMHGTWKAIGINVALGILIGGGFLAIVGFGYEWLKKQEGLGGGDVKLAAMLGAFFGWKGIIFILLLSSILGSLIGIIMMVVFKRGLKYAVPYGPFLAAGAIVYLFWGERILNWYLGLL